MEKIEFVNNLVLPVLAAGVIGGFALLFKWGRELYAKTQERITNLELRIHKRELGVRLGGLIETNKGVKEFFAAYDYLYRQAKDKSAEHFIDKINAIIIATQQTDKPLESHDRALRAVIAEAEEKGYQRKFITAAEEQEITEAKMRLLNWQNAIPDKIEIEIKD